MTDADLTGLAQGEIVELGRKIVRDANAAEKSATDLRMQVEMIERAAQKLQNDTFMPKALARQCKEVGDFDGAASHVIVYEGLVGKIDGYRQDSDKRSAKAGDFEREAHRFRQRARTLAAYIKRHAAP